MSKPAPAGSVTVKKLDWDEVNSPREDGPSEPTGDLEAGSPIGTYSIVIDADEDVALSPWCVWAPDENLGAVESAG